MAAMTISAGVEGSPRQDRVSDVILAASRDSRAGSRRRKAQPGVPGPAPNARYLKAGVQARPRKTASKAGTSRCPRRLRPVRRRRRRRQHRYHPTITELAAALETGQPRLGPRRPREPWPPY